MRHARLQWCSIFHYYWWTDTIKPMLLFSLCKLCFLKAFPFSQIDLKNIRHFHIWDTFSSIYVFTFLFNTLVLHHYVGKKCQVWAFVTIFQLVSWKIYMVLGVKLPGNRIINLSSRVGSWVYSNVCQVISRDMDCIWHIPAVRENLEA